MLMNLCSRLGNFDLFSTKSVFKKKKKKKKKKVIATF